MDWGDILPAVIAFLTAILLPLFFMKRKKGGQKKLKEFYQHLQGVGVNSFLLDKGCEQEKMEKRASRGERSEGVVGVEDRNIDFITIISVTSQYGVNYFLDYLVKSSTKMRKEAGKKTRMIRKKSSPIWGKVIDIEWRGDQFLAQRLNFDYELKYKLLQADLNKLKGSIWIFPESKHGYSRIRTHYHLPALDIFEAIDTIARYIKSEV